MICEVDWCDRGARVRGLCHRHAENLRRKGVAVILRPTMVERLWMKIERADSGCWIWTGSRSSAGYGTFNVGERRYDFAHRVMYQLLVGEIPDGLQLDHVCHSRDTSCRLGAECPHRACVNPSHLEPVTSRVNTLRGRRHT